MNSELKDGGQVTAMSLRDHFAGLAMQAILTAILTSEEAADSFGTMASERGIGIIAAVSLEAYEQADAMLAERAKGAK